MSSSVKFIQDLKQLCSEKNNQPFVARDEGLLKGLVMFLVDASEDVVLGALETICMLSSHELNLDILGTNHLLVERVNSIRSRHANPKCKEVGGQIWKNISTHVPAGEIDKENVSNTNVPLTAAKGKAAAAGGFGGIDSSSNNYSINSFFVVNTKDAKMYQLKIDGMLTEYLRHRVEQALLGIKGVISFTLDCKTQSASVRTVMPLVELIELLSKKTPGMNVYELGHEPKTDDKAEDEMPQYLDDKVSKSATSKSKGQIVEFGSKSFEERLEEKRRKEQAQSSWIGWASSKLSLW